MKTNHWLVAAVVILAIALAAESIYLFRSRNEKTGDGKEPTYRVTSVPSRSSYGRATPSKARFQGNDPFSNPGFDSYDPFQEMDQIQQMMNRMFRDSFSRGAFGRGIERQSFYEPDLDVEDTKDAYLIRLDLPGIDKDKISIKIQNNILSVSGERKTEREENQEDGSYYRMERSFGSFMRSFPLPADADSNAMTAENKNGVLTIRLPKTKGTATPIKNISVQ